MNFNSKLDETVISYVRSALPLLRKFDPTSEIAVEQNVIHPNLYYFGRFDAIIRYKDTFFLIDFKTNDSSSMKLGNDVGHFYSGPLQIAAYIGAVNCLPAYSSLSTVKTGAIVNVKEDGSEADFNEISFSKLEEFWFIWLKRVQRFWYELSNRPMRDGSVSFLYDGKKK
uniref:PDDEXK_1 domain-containing protein n=1 Tax=Syphacia muris TaxID=451379 RepID=A0A0N5AVP5_9BILA